MGSHPGGYLIRPRRCTTDERWIIKPLGKIIFTQTTSAPVHLVVQIIRPLCKINRVDALS